MTVHADVANVVVGVSLLEAKFQAGSMLDYSGSLTLKLKDPNTDARITAAEITSSTATQLVTVADTQVFNVSLTASIGAGIDVTNNTGQLVNLATATLTITSPPGGVSIFGSPSGSSGIAVTFNATPGSTTVNILNSFNNAGPNEIVAMLGEVGNLFAAIAQSQGLQQTRIPFTNVTIGDALDFARVFKNEVLDPLFKSGDALKPDGNGDGQVDVKDFNFNGIQSLLDRLAVAVGLSPGALRASYNTDTNELKFNFVIDPWFGLGTSAEALTGPKAEVTTIRQGSGSQNEVQELVVNATSGVFKLSFGGESTSASRPREVSAASLQTASDGLSTIGSPNVNVTRDADTGVYRIEFVSGSATRTSRRSASTSACPGSASPSASSTRASTSRR